MAKMGDPVGQDRNFDDLAGRFERNIYGSSKGAVRLAVVMRDLGEVLSEEGPLQVLDAGAGLGQVALRLAQQGHALTLCDHSTEMLSRAEERFAAHPEMAATFLYAPVQALSSQLDGRFDLILFHAVLEWLAEPRETLQGLLRLLRPGGRLSLLFYNRDALLLRNLVWGNLEKVKSGDLAGRQALLTPDQPLQPQEVYSWLDSWGLERELTSGVRVFCDYMSRETRKRVDLDELIGQELAFSRREPYLSLGRYIHVVARWPGPKGG